MQELRRDDAVKPLMRHHMPVVDEPLGIPQADDERVAILGADAMLTRHEGDRPRATDIARPLARMDDGTVIVADANGEVWAGSGRHAVMLRRAPGVSYELRGFVCPFGGK